MRLKLLIKCQIGICFILSKISIFGRKFWKERYNYHKEELKEVLEKDGN